MSVRKERPAVAERYDKETNGHHHGFQVGESMRVFVLGNVVNHSENVNTVEMSPASNWLLAYNSFF